MKKDYMVVSNYTHEDVYPNLREARKKAVTLSKMIADKKDNMVFVHRWLYDEDGDCEIDDFFTLEYVNGKEVKQ